MKTVLIASNNAHKAVEIAEALDFPGWEFKTLKQAGVHSDPVEDFWVMPASKLKQLSRLAAVWRC